MANEKGGQIGIRIDSETRELIEGELEYGDSISAWVRDAIELRIDEEGIDEGNPNQMVMAD